MRVSLLAAVDLFFAGLCTSSLSRSVLSLSRVFSLCVGVCLSFFFFCLPFCVRLSVSFNYKFLSRLRVGIPNQRLSIGIFRK